MLVYYYAPKKGNTMTTKTNSIFNLIEIFRKTKTRMMKNSLYKTNCETHFHDDYYCDAEQPHITQ